MNSSLVRSGRVICSYKSTLPVYDYDIGSIIKHERNEAQDPSCVLSPCSFVLPYYFPLLAFRHFIFSLFALAIGFLQIRMKASI